MPHGLCERAVEHGSEEAGDIRPAASPSAIAVRVEARTRASARQATPFIELRLSVTPALRMVGEIAQWDLIASLYLERLWNADLEGEQDFVER